MATMFRRLLSEDELAKLSENELRHQWAAWQGYEKLAWPAVPEYQRLRKSEGSDGIWEWPSRTEMINDILDWQRGVD